MQKYLYTFHPISGWSQHEITKETPAFYWCGDKKISKKTLKTGKGIMTLSYKEEAPEILEKFQRQEKFLKFQRKLEKLKNCQNESIIDLILSIQEK